MKLKKMTPLAILWATDSFNENMRKDIWVSMMAPKTILLMHLTNKNHYKRVNHFNPQSDKVKPIRTDS